MANSTAEIILQDAQAYDFELKQISEPDFDQATKVHDWRNYVPVGVEVLWPSLSEETRAVAFLMAHEQSSNENWE